MTAGGRDAASAQKDAMDILQQWADDFTAYARPTTPLRSGGEAGGAQLRLRYSRGEDVSILHLVAVTRDGRPVILARRFDGAMPDAAVQAGLWASEQLGRRQAGESRG
jgi:hypothetical protein